MKNINRKFLWGLLVIIVAFVLLLSSLVVIPVMNVGVINRQDKFDFLSSGVHMRIPFTRVHLINLSQRVSYVSVNSQAMTNTYGVVWQVSDVQQYWNVTQDDDARVKALFADHVENLSQDVVIKSAGIQVNAIMLTGQSLPDASLKTTYQNMQGLADSIATGIIAAGTKNAEALRRQGDDTLVQIEGDAAAASAAIVAEGQVEAITMNAPLYHKNPELFKLLVDSKARFGN